MAARRSGARGKGSGPGGASVPTAPETDGAPPLSLERIVSAAVELLDEDGIGGLTMRRLADRLGAGAMSLYWHVGGKEEVFDLALDRVLRYREPPPATAPGDWRARAVHVLEDWRASMLRHPWSAALLPQRALGPGMLGRLEFLGATLSEAGIPDADLNVAIWSLWNYVMGATVTRASFGRPPARPAATAKRDLAPAGEEHPTIERTRLLMDEDWDGAFARGLAFLLDGLAPR